jgi:hypothetical protein
MMIDKKKSTHRERFERVQELMRLAVETDGKFKVFPPPEVRKDESLLAGDDVVDRMTETIWKVEFRNGTRSSITFTDLVLLLYNFREINQQMEEADIWGDGEPVAIKLVTTCDPKKVMKPKVIRALFRRMDQKRKKG